MPDLATRPAPGGASGLGGGDRRPLVVVAYDAPWGDPDSPPWRWFESDFPEIRWELYGSIPSYRLERKFPRVMLLRTRCAWEAVRAAKRGDAGLLITNEPELTYRCGLMARAIGLRVPHVAWAFNYAGLPRGRTRLSVLKAGFRAVDRFVISSSMERKLYADHFGIPPEKFDLHLWSVGEPGIARPEAPIEPGHYICSVGGNARDYRTLLRAMALLPDIRLVVVTRPEAVAGLEVPPNVTVRYLLPNLTTNNVIAHSRFTVLPLADGRTPNGHVTLVSSMKMARATVITASEGVMDYVHDGVDALVCEPGSATSMAGAIRTLWDDPARAERLGAAARAFATEHCAEENAREYLRGLFRRYGLIAPDPRPSDRLP